MAIQYEYGHEPTGELIAAADAQKDVTYCCPACASEYVLRKSGNTGPRAKRPHFAHKDIEITCEPETVLHATFKRLIFDMLTAYQIKGRKVVFSWYCRFCHDHHKGDLLRGVTQVDLERAIGERRPDLTVTKRNGAQVAIEVVVTHSPEPEAIAYYEQRKIHLMVYEIAAHDLSDPLRKLRQPDAFRTDWCPNPICAICSYHKDNVGHCRQCEHRQYRRRKAARARWRRTKQAEYLKQQQQEKKQFMEELARSVANFDGAELRFLEDMLRQFRAGEPIEVPFWIALGKLHRRIENPRHTFPTGLPKDGFW